MSCCEARETGGITQARAYALVVLHIYSCVSDEMPIGKYCRLGYAGMEENIEDRDDDVGVGEKGNAWIGFERP